jgi:hypothetical protein
MSTDDDSALKDRANDADAPTHDDTPTAADLTEFQLAMLSEIAGLEQAGETPHGLGIKSELEGYYGEEVYHGRLYPNLDDLVEQGLVEKGTVDRRTNSYELTADGRYVLRSHAQRVIAKLGDDVPPQEADA